MPSTNKLRAKGHLNLYTQSNSVLTKSSALLFAFCLTTSHCNGYDITSHISHLTRRHVFRTHTHREAVCLSTDEIPEYLINPLNPKDAYIDRTAPLTSRRYILYIYSKTIRTEYFKHAAHSPFFPLQNVIYFIILRCLVPVIFAFYIQVC